MITKKVEAIIEHIGFFTLLKRKKKKYQPPKFLESNNRKFKRTETVTGEDKHFLYHDVSTGNKEISTFAVITSKKSGRPDCCWVTFFPPYDQLLNFKEMSEILKHPCFINNDNFISAALIHIIFPGASLDNLQDSFWYDETKFHCTWSEGKMDSGECVPICGLDFTQMQLDKSTKDKINNVFIAISKSVPECFGFFELKGKNKRQIESNQTALYPGGKMKFWKNAEKEHSKNGEATEFTLPNQELNDAIKRALIGCEDNIIRASRSSSEISFL